MQTLKSTLLSLFLLVSHLLSANAQTPFVTVASRIVTTPLQISTQKTTVLVFSAAIAENGVDRGSAQILAKTVDGVSNVIKVKAASDSLQPTNLTIFTSDGRIYRFTVSYRERPEQDFYDFTRLPEQASSEHVLFTAERLNDAAILKAAGFISELPAHRSCPRSNRNGKMQMRIKGIYLHAGVLFLQLSFANNSGVPFEVDFIRCYQKDRKKSKRTSQMEKEVTPLATSYQKKPTIGGNLSDYTIVLAFEKFTIADNKFFMVEAFEKNGDRHLAIKVKGQDILKAKPILVSM